MTHNRRPIGSMNKMGIAILVGAFPMWSPPLAMTDTGENNPSAGESRSAQREPNGGTNHWSYEGVEGPGHWAMLEPSYMACETGRQQSPINIEMPQTGENQEDLTFHYQPTPLRVLNNGHTIQVNYQEGSYLRLNGQSYKLRQFHFHDPSEHHIDGKIYPMEMHLVHQDDAGHTLVVSLLMAFGKENQVFSLAGICWNSKRDTVFHLRWVKYPLMPPLMLWTSFHPIRIIFLITAPSQHHPAPKVFNG